jgi:NAD(P)H-dependent FMN reductase
MNKKVLLFAGSLRTGSLNKKYVKVAHAILHEITGLDTELVDLADYPMPVYNQDIEDKEFPQPAADLARKVAGVDALVISTPENNGSIAAALKNTVDWLSRPPHNPWPGKCIFLMGASPGALGAVRGLWHSRIPFEALGCHVYPDMSGLPRAHEAFDENGELKDKASRERLAKQLKGFANRIF